LHFFASFKLKFFLAGGKLCVGGFAKSFGFLGASFGFAYRGLSLCGTTLVLRVDKKVAESGSSDQSGENEENGKGKCHGRLPDFYATQL
jgi:hypothetical protein